MGIHSAGLRSEDSGEEILKQVKDKTKIYGSFQRRPEDITVSVPARIEELKSLALSTRIYGKDLPRKGLR